MCCIYNQVFVFAGQAIAQPPGVRIIAPDFLTFC